MTTAAAAGAMTLAAAAPAHAAPTDQAVWHMDSVPEMIDSAGGDNNGTTSAITMSSDGFYTFNGSTSIASVPHESNLNPGSANIKVATRLYTATPPAVGETYDIVRKGTSRTAGGYYKIELKGTSTGMSAACVFKDTNKVVGRAMLRIPSQTWLTITCTKDATTVKLVVATVTKTTTKTTTKTIGAISNTAGVYVGGKGDGTDVFSGLMDSASITIG